VLIGRGGNDQLAGRDNSWWTELPPPIDAGEPLRWSSAAGDAVQCGSGRDGVFGRRTADFTPLSCETIYVHRRLPKSIGGPRALTCIDPYPARDRRGLYYYYYYQCSDSMDWEHPAWERLRCSGRVELRTTGRRHRLLAYGRLRADVPWSGNLNARLALTALGRARMARRTDTRARVQFFGRPPCPNRPMDDPPGRPARHLRPRHAAKPAAARARAPRSG
jgi:hypothetical protein